MTQVKATQRVGGVEGCVAVGEPGDRHQVPAVPGFGVGAVVATGAARRARVGS